MDLSDLVFAGLCKKEDVTEVGNRPTFDNYDKDVLGYKCEYVTGDINWIPKGIFDSNLSRSVFR